MTLSPSVFTEVSLSLKKAVRFYAVDKSSHFRTYAVSRLKNGKSSPVLQCSCGNLATQAFDAEVKEKTTQLSESQLRSRYRSSSENRRNFTRCSDDCISPRIFAIRPSALPLSCDRESGTSCESTTFSFFFPLPY